MKNRESENLREYGKYGLTLLELMTILGILGISVVLIINFFGAMILNFFS